MFRNKLKKQAFYIIALLAVLGAQSVFAQTTDFTYQGKLNDGGNPANAIYDMQFRLFDLAGAGQGTQQGATITNPTVTVTNGNFAVSLDFGAAVFASGADRFLEISLRPAGNTGGYTSLAPRQKLTSAPYSVRSISANSADTLSIACVGCVQNSNINSVDGNKVTGTVANSTNAVNATNATSATTATTATTADNVSGIVAIENGGTGSAKQNFVDLTSDQTIDGNKAFNGTVTAGTFSGNGAGLTNVIQVQTFGGFLGTIPTSSGWIFPNSLNTTATVTLNGNQRITGSASAVLGVMSGIIDIRIDLCYQSTSGGTVTNFSAENHLIPYVTTNRLTYAVSASVVPEAGEYRVGFCTRSNAAANNSHWVQGWIMITNN